MSTWVWEKWGSMHMIGRRKWNKINNWTVLGNKRDEVSRGIWWEREKGNRKSSSLLEGWPLWGRAPVKHSCNEWRYQMDTPAPSPVITNTETNALSENGSSVRVGTYSLATVHCMSVTVLVKWIKETVWENKGLGSEFEPEEVKQKS